MSYPSIADHGLIGDLQTAAWSRLTGRSTGSAALASTHRACSRPCWTTARVAASLAPVTPATTTKQMHMPDTAILVTRHLSESGIAEVLDFMPIDRPHVVSDRRRIVRVVRGSAVRSGLRGAGRAEVDYARQAHKVHVNGTSAVFESGGAPGSVRSVAARARRRRRSIPVHRSRRRARRVRPRLGRAGRADRARPRRSRRDVPGDRGGTGVAGCRAPTGGAGGTRSNAPPSSSS